jgi:tetratricopeptide (TPR) repeat protein
LACTTVQPEPDTVRPSAAQREEVDAIDVLLAQARTHLAAGAPQRALQVTGEALERARALAFGPAIARALHERGRIVTTVGDLPELSAETAIGDLEEATQRALEARAFPLAIEAWSRQAWLRGTRGGDTKTLLDQSAVLLAMAQGSANASVAQALLYNNLGGLHLVQADHPAARPLFQRAIEITGTLEQPTRELENAPLNLALITEDNDARAALFERVIAERSRVLGPEHPQVLEVQLVYATTAASDVAGDVFEALGQRYQRFHPEFSKQRFEVHEEAAWTALASADRPAARRHFAAAAALDETDPLARRVAQGLADLLAGDTKSAGEVLRAVTKETVSTPWQRGPIAHAHLGLALAERDPAQLRAAAALFATLAYLPTAVVARRFAYASATLEDVVPQLAAVRQAVDAWRNGVGSRAELDRALQAASAQPQLSPHTLPTSPTQIESQ